jgi:hypothetical protein
MNLNKTLPLLNSVGTALTAGGQIYGGNAAASGARSEASQLRYAAGQTRASSQRAAREERRQARRLQSRGLAVAAASGGGASDVSVVNTLAEVEAEGEYRALTALWEGEEQARGLEAAAGARESEGSAARTAGYLAGGASLLTGGVDWFQKYGNPADTTLEPIEVTAQRIPTTRRRTGTA